MEKELYLYRDITHKSEITMKVIDHCAEFGHCSYDGSIFNAFICLYICHITKCIHNIMQELLEALVLRNEAHERH